ncbi:hypothetical protein SPAN111604_11565 [Sphingomonas antarctica]
MPISATGSNVFSSHRERRLGATERGWLFPVATPTPARAPRDSPLPMGGESGPASSRRSETGFTLIELMVVLVIVALASAAVVTALPSGAAGLRQEATAFAARAVAARNAAIVSGRPARVTADGAGYRVEERRGGRWLPWGGKAGRPVAWERDTRATAAVTVAFDSTGLSDPATLRLQRAGRAIAVQVSADGTVRVEE